MHFTLHQLKVFVEVADQGSITKAAEALHLTQPAVSIQLKKLQDQLEIPIIEVISRKVYLTDFGKEIANASRKILRETDLIQTTRSSYLGLLSGDLKISIVSTAKYIMPYFLTDFLKMHPQVKLTMDVTNKATVLEHLNDNSVDFALVSVLPENLSVEKQDLMSNRLYLVRKATVAKTLPKLNLKDLQNENFVFREKGSTTRQAMEQFMRSNGITTNRQITLTSNEAVKQAVLAGLGFTVTPLIGIKNELLSGQLQIVNVKGLPITTTWNLIWLKGKNQTPISAAFLTYIEENKEKIIRDKFDWYENV